MDENTISAADVGAPVVDVKKDGVIDYPLFAGMELDGVWSVTPSPVGPGVAAADGFLHYSVTSMRGWNQWCYVSISTMLPGQASILTYQVRANVIQGSEVKFTVADNVILRFTSGGQSVNWQWFDSNGRFQTLAPSSIRANGAWHTVTMVFSPTSVSLLEDGKYLFTWNIAARDQVSPVFHMQVLDTGASMSFDVGEIYSVPPAYADGISTPWDYSFTPNTVPPAAAIATVSTQGGPQVSYGVGYARFAASPLTMNDTAASLTVQQSAPSVSVQIYRLRINEAGGSETRVAFPGGQVLRRSAGALNWQYYTSSGTWQTLAASSVVVGAADYAIIALVTSGSSVTVFENGTFRYQFPLPGAPVTGWQPAVAVQQLTAGTNVSVDLGGIRTLPVIKTLELLGGDLQDETLAFFPLIGNFANALGNSADLALFPAGGQVPFAESPFGVSANFAGGSTALSIPPLAAATSSSYTLSAWAKVNAYPPAGTVTGIAGSLLLDSSGHLVFRFLFNGGGMYQERRYVSDHALPLGDWHNIVVTYSFEESRLGIFMDGRLCCLEYMGEGLVTASTSVPAAFFVGGDQASADAPLVVLDGAVGVVIILTQHIHQPTVPVFTSRPTVPAAPRAPQPGAEVAPRAAFVLFAWLVVAVVVVVVAIVVENYFLQEDQSTKDTYPSVAELVSRIRGKTGTPAAPGVQVSRADISSPTDQKIHLDVGGEGRVDVSGLVVGFSGAINVNAVAKTGDPSPPKATAPGRLKGATIPNLVEIAAWDANPGLPFADGFADAISMIDMDLTNRDIAEIARVIRDGGTIDLWLQEKYLPGIQDLAGRVGAVVQEPEEISDFRGNGKPDDRTWFKRRSIIARKAGAGNQPYAATWYPDGLIAWDPATDPDAAFNRSRVPLADRAWDANLRANTNARAGQGDIMALGSFGATARNPSQGAVGTADYYALGYWQYLGTLVFWGGSAGEGIILAPNPTVIDAAHRNGVPVLGNVFFPPAAYGGKIDWVRQFTDSRMPAKLVQVAQYFGFDGWFINQETNGGDAALATAVRSTLTQVRQLAPGLKIVWYDAMTASGPVIWQGTLNANNAMFFQNGSARVTDDMFLDFVWARKPGSLPGAAGYASQLGRSGLDLYAGVDVEPTGYDNDGLAKIFPADGTRIVSAGIHRTDWTYSSSTSIADFYARESTFWTGPAGDPSKATTTDKWRAPASIVAERTPITAKPFVTSFNTGQGKLYAVDGTMLSTLGWNNLGLQDVLPTYRWMVSGPSGSPVPRLDLSDAYNGGTSLLVGGSTQGPVVIRLYQTRLPVTASTKLLVTLKAPAAGPSYLQIGTTYAAISDPDYHDAGSGPAGWRTATFDLGNRQGQTLVRIDLRILAPSADYRVRIGQIAVTDGALTVPPPTGVTLVGAARISPTRQTLRLHWTAPAGPVHHYNVYRRNPGNDRTYLGGTSNDAYFVPQLDRVGSETSTIIDVESVSPTFDRSAPGSVTVAW